MMAAVQSLQHIADNVNGVSDKKLLYAICILYRDKDGRFKGVTEYCHAKDAGDARLQYLRSEPRWREVRVEAVAPVIGYHTNDENGDRLHV